MGKPVKERLNLALPTASMASIDNLQDMTDAATTSEVIRRAIKLYEAIVANQKAGKQLVFRDPTGQADDCPLVVL